MHKYKSRPMSLFIPRSQADMDTSIDAYMERIGFERETGYTWINHTAPDSDIIITRSLLTHLRMVMATRDIEDLPRMILDPTLAQECIGKDYLWRGVQRPQLPFAPDLHKYLISPLLTLWLQELERERVCT